MGRGNVKKGESLTGTLEGFFTNKSAYDLCISCYNDEVKYF